MDKKQLLIMVLAVIIFGVGYFIVEGNVIMGFIPMIIGCGLVGGSIGMFASALLKLLAPVLSKKKK